MRPPRTVAQALRLPRPDSSGRSARAPYLLQDGAGRGQRFAGALQVRDGFGARARILGQDRSQNQVRALARRGKRGKRAARLAQDPNRFLSAVQIGVTVATLLSGAFGAATLASDLRKVLGRHISAGLASVLDRKS